MKEDALAERCLWAVHGNYLLDQAEIPRAPAQEDQARALAQRFRAAADVAFVRPPTAA